MFTDLNLPGRSLLYKRPSSFFSADKPSFRFTDNTIKECPDTAAVRKIHLSFQALLPAFRITGHFQP